MVYQTKALMLILESMSIAPKRLGSKMTATARERHTNPMSASGHDRDKGVCNVT